MWAWARGFAAAAFGLALISSAAAERLAIAYDPAGPDPRLANARDVLMSRHALEELRAFLAPLRLPTAVTLRTATCGGPRMPYDAATHTATVCYEMIARIIDVADANGAGDPKARRLAIIGATVEALLHETAYGIFDVLDVPIWGRIDDAADRFAALVMTQFGEDSEFVTVRGTAQFFAWSGHSWNGSEFASDVSPERQRFFNYLCIAAGADPFLNRELAQQVMSPHRVARCREEYEQVRKAFDLRIMPYVDPDLLIKARARQW